jgi:hypothetical protein
MRHALLALLVAAAGPLLPAGAARAADTCAAASTAVAVAEVSFADGVVTAHGSWEVKGASSVMLEYRIDQDRHQSEVRPGSSGTWEVTQAFALCGQHTLRVYAFPAVQEGGRLVHCLERGVSQPGRFTVSCAPVARIDACTWQCAGEGAERRCAGTCTGSATGGRGLPIPFWGLDGAGFQAVPPPAAGPWTQAVSCTPGQRVSFKVRDRHGAGAWSEVVEKACGEP